MPTNRAYAGVALAAAAWGTWSLFLRRAGASQPIAPALATLVIFSSIALILLPWALQSTRRTVRRRTSWEWVLLTVFGVSDALNCVLYFAALQATSVSVAVLTHYVAPLLVALSAPLVLKEPRRPGTLFAVAIGLAGLVLLLAPWEVQAGEEGARLWRGALLGLCSAVFFAAGVLFNKRLARSFDAAELIVYHLPSALALLVVLVPRGAWTLSAPGFAWLLAGAVGPGAIAGVVFVRSLKLVPAGHASVLTLVEPFTALSISALALGERFGLRTLLGGGAILAAGYLVVRGDRVPQPLLAPRETGA